MTNQHFAPTNRFERKIRLVIAPSILSGDFANLERDCRRMLQAGADELHVDVMDNHFVPNLTIGAPVVKSIHRAVAEAVLDVHLMVSDPKSLIAPMAEAGASRFTFHIEATSEWRDVARSVRAAGMRVGVAIRPSTPLDELASFLDEQPDALDAVLVMTVEPGFGGQAIIMSALDKVRRLRASHPTLAIQVDGGIKVGETIEAAAAAGANYIVSGSGIFGAPEGAKAAIDAMRKVLEGELKKRKREESK